ncbi:MAG: hypothetical protein ACRD1P_00520 [Thermoanaerobaculia bacterium]
MAKAAQARETPTPGRILQWTRHIRPAFESVIRVTLEKRDGKPVFQVSIGESPVCAEPVPPDPLLDRVALLLATRGELIRAKVGDPAQAFVGLSPDIEHLAAAQRKYRAMVLSHPNVQRRLMPRLHQLLEASDAVCPDCPGPTRLPASRNIGYAELMPYVLAHLWPVEVGPDGGLSMQFCAGINGVQEMKAPDPLLVDAGFDLVFGNWGAIDAATRNARDAARSPECKKLDSEARVAYVRAYLARVLPSETRFQEALRPAIQALPEIGLACSDCP